MRFLTSALIGLAMFSMLAATTATEEVLILEEATFEIPSQTIDGWYQRGEPAREAEQLEAYLQVLIWGTDAGAVLRAEEQGRSITVDLNGGLVTVVDTSENVDRVGNELDPGLEPLFRQRILDRNNPSSSQAATGISSLPADAGSGLISRRPRTTEGSQTGRRSNTMYRTLRYDDSLTFRDLRLTLIDVYAGSDSGVTVDEDGETTVRLTAVFDATTPTARDEFEIVERRSLVFESYRIRVESAQLDPEQSARVEITDLSR